MEAQKEQSGVEEDLPGITVQVVSADNVWLLEPGEDKSKAALIIKFPGKGEGETVESEVYPPFIPPLPEPTPEELAAQQAAAEAEAAAKPKGKDDKKKGGKPEDAGPPVPGNYPISFSKTFHRKSHWPLWHTMTTEPMIVTLQWVAPSGASRAPVGTCNIDLGPLLRLNKQMIELSCVLEVPKEEPATAGGKEGKAPPPKKETGKKGAEATPPLLKGAVLKVVLSTTWPLLHDIDRTEAVDIDIKGFAVKQLPVKVAEFAEKSADDPFLYSMAFQFPGFAGTWWDSVTGLEPEEKQQLSLGKPARGVVRTPSSPPEGEEPPPAETIVKWRTSFKRFLPSEAAIELKKRTRRKNLCYGEIARNIKDGRPDVFDPCFNNYRCGFWLDLTPLLKDGVTEAKLTCTLGDCKPEGQPLLTQLNRTVDMKKATAVEQVDANDPAKNFWKEAHSVLELHVKMSQPLEPIWKPPPEPEMKLDDVIPPRPKKQTVYSASQLAMKDFNEFIKVAARVIGSTHLRLVQVGRDQKVKIAPSRVEHMEDMRKQLSQELHKLGAWQEMREKMKEKVKKVASEKFKFKKEDAIAAGKFAFCNALYVQLMDEIQSCLREVFAQKNILDKSLPGAVYTLDYLREVADEYEVDKNFRAADKFHLDRIVGEGVAWACAWYEYGSFWMRHKERDHGKAEECFRESINLHRQYLPSLQALACLHWHRGLHGHAEAILRSIIELETQDEFIYWAILARVHAARSERSSYLSCRRRAEVTYNQLIASSEQTPTLSMESSKHPFSPTKFVLRSPLSNSPFVQAALLLLDLHLPAEALELLRMEDDVFSVTVEFYLCLALVSEFQGDQAHAEKMFEEALNLEYEDPRTWCLLAHIRYTRGQLQEALYAYKKVLQFSKCGHLVYQYAYQELGDIYLQLGEFEESRQIFLKGVGRFPTSSLWLGAGAAFFRLGDALNAEKALVEGNLLDSQNFKIWAYLTLLCIVQGRMEEAEFTFTQSLEHVKNAKLLAEIGIAFSSKRNFRLAQVALTESLNEEENLDVRFHLADVVYHLPWNKD